LISAVVGAAVLVAPAPAAEATTPTNHSALVAEVIRLTNVERAKVGAPALTANAQLAKAAQDYAKVLAKGGCFSHNCGPVPNPGKRIRNAGYNWRAWGENIAAGDQTAAAVMARWMKSSGHRANILNRNFRDIGVGIEDGAGPYYRYWVQDFGRRL
jgi:uncharacterized protein YkwD